MASAYVSAAKFPAFFLHVRFFNRTRYNCNNMKYNI
jgi:hypothetical protein